MIRSIKTEAFVLKKITLLHKDTVLVLFTKEKGKLHVLAKGIKKITSRRQPHHLTGNLVKIMLSSKNDRYFLQESHLKSHFFQIKESKAKMDIVYQLFFLLDRILPENQPEYDVYESSRAFIIKLSNEKKRYVEIYEAYLNQLFQHLGYTDKEHLSLTQLLMQAEEIIQEKIPLSSI